MVIGDGGLGIGGWDIETALRYELPIVTVLWNNSSWGPSFEQMPMLQGPHRSVRHAARTFATTACSATSAATASTSSEPDEIAPALERAFARGKASLRQRHRRQAHRPPQLGGNLLGSTKV